MADWPGRGGPLWTLVIVLAALAVLALVSTAWGEENAVAPLRLEVRLEGTGVWVRLSPTVAGQAYELLSKETLAQRSWQVEQEVKGRANATETTVPLLGRERFFLAGREKGAMFVPAEETPCPARLDLMLVLDVSHSMSDEDFRLAKTAAGQFVDGLDRRVDRVGLVSFAGTAVLESALTPELEVVKAALSGLGKRDGTLLQPAIDLARQALEPARAETLRVILLMSDGVVGGPNKTANIQAALDAAGRAQLSGIRRICLAYGSDAGGLSLMRQLASSSTDYHYRPASQDLGELFETVAATLCRTGPPVNQPPWVVLEEPGDGLFLPAPWMAVTVRARAGDAEGPLAWLETQAGDVVLGRTTAGNVQQTWRPPTSGEYLVRARAQDAAGLVAETAPVRVRVNGAPTVEAGPDRTVTLVGGVAETSLAGQVTDDGWPAGAGLTVNWRVVSGPGLVSLAADPAAPGNLARARASFRRVGVYVLRLEAADSLLGASDELEVTVTKINEAPVVWAGPDQTVREGQSVYLPGAVSDDGAPVGGKVGVQWMGPAGVEFSSASQTNSHARLPGPGVYELALRAWDGAVGLGGLSATGRVRITVQGQHEPWVMKNMDARSVGVGGMRGRWVHYDPLDALSWRERVNPQGGIGVLSPGELPGPIERALLYWHGPLNPARPEINGAITVNGRWVEGVPLDSGYDNGWKFQDQGHAFERSRAYRADVTSLVRAFGPGPYVLSNLVKGVEVEANGASLVVFFQDGQPENNHDQVLVEGHDSTASVGSYPVRPVNFNGALVDPVPAAVHGLALEPDGVIIAGRFMMANTPGRHGIARLRGNGRLHEDFAPSPGASPVGDVWDEELFAVRTVARTADGRVWIGGNFREVDGQARPYLARLGVDGKLDGSFDARLDGPVHVVRLDGQGRVLVGGDFQSVQGQPRRSLARFSAAGVLDTTFAPAVSGVVQALAVQADGQVVAGGLFPEVNGQPRNNLARLRADGTLDASFTPEIHGVVRAVLVRANRQVAVGGRFSQVNQTERTGLVLLEANGTINQTFVPDLTGTGWEEESQVYLGYPDVHALVEHQGRILAAGRFVRAHGQVCGRVARLLEDGRPDPGFRCAPGPDPAVDQDGSDEPDQTSIDALAVQGDGRIIIGGCFEGLHGAVAARAVARLHADGSVDHSFSVSDEGWSVTIPGLAYQEGPVSVELHVSDGQPARVVGFQGPEVPVWRTYVDPPVHLNGVPWLLPEPTESGNGRVGDMQIFAGVSVPGAWWPREELAGLWDVRSAPVPAAVLQPGLTSLHVHAGNLGLDPLLGIVRQDAISLVAALARLPMGQVQPLPNPAVPPPADLPPVAWADQFELCCGSDRRVLHVLGNDLATDGQCLRVVEVTQPAGGRCQIVHENSAVLFEANAGFSGWTAFNYAVQDSRGRIARANARVMVDRPRANLLQPGQPRFGILPMCDCTNLSLSVALNPEPPSGSATPPVSGAPAVSGAVPVDNCANWTVCTNATRGQGQYACFHDFTAAAGETVSLALSQAGFPAHLYLRDPAGALVASAAHTWNVPDPVLEHTITTSGRYTVEVTTHDAGQTGPYVLELALWPPNQLRLELEVAGQVLRPRDTADLGLLEPGQSLTFMVRNPGPMVVPRLEVTTPNPLGTLEGAIHPVSAGPLPAGQSLMFQWNLGAGQPAGALLGTLVLDSEQRFEFHLRAHINPPEPSPLESLAIVSPAPGALFPPLGTIPVVVEVQPNGPDSFARVELLARTQGRLQSLAVREQPDPDNQNRYSFLWRAVPEGAHELIAQARLGQHLVRSAVVPVEVGPPAANRPPRVVADVLTVLPDSQANRLHVLANDTDPESDPLRLIGASASGGTVRVAPEGAALLYTPPPHLQGADALTYEVSDGRGGISRGQAVVHIVAEPVRLEAPLDLAVHPMASPLPLRARAATPAGSFSRVEFLVDDQIVARVAAPAAPTIYSASWRPSSPGHHTVRAAAYDANGARLVSAPVRVQVYEGSQPPPPDAPPQAVIESPVDQQRVRDGFLAVRGTADDDDGPVSYELLVRQPADERVVARLSGAGPVRGALLGTLDLTVLRNGSYVLELQVSQGFGQARARTSFLLDSQAKVGQLSFSEQDLLLPVGGLPIQLVRTYDSLKVADSRLGPGWTFTLGDLEASMDEQREDRPRDPLQPDPEDTLSLRVGGGRNLTLTLPDGRRTTFAFSLVPGPSDGGAPCYCYRALWTPPPGVHATLTPLEDDRLQFIPWQPTIQPFWAASGPQTPWENYDFRGFVLTNDDGTRFELEAPVLGDLDLNTDEDPTAQLLDATVRGPLRLTRIVRPHGERLEFTDRGIQHFQPGATTASTTLALEPDPGDARRLGAVYAPDSLDAQGRPLPGAVPHVRYQYYPPDHPAAGQLNRVHRLVDRSMPGAPVYETIEYLYEQPEAPHLLTATRLHGPGPNQYREVRHQFDEQGRWTGSADPAGHRTRLSHDPANRRTTITDAQGRTTHYEYDPRGNVVRTLDAFGQVTTRTYDDQDNLLAQTDSLGHTTTYGYDARGRVIALTNALGQVTRATYDLFGNALTTTDARGAVTVNGFNPAGLPVSTRDALGGLTSFIHDDHGRLVSTRDADGTVTTNLHDTAGRLQEAAVVRWEANAWVTLSRTTYTYDALGRTLTETAHLTAPDGQPRTVVTGHAYDERGRLRHLTNDHRGLDLVTTHSYDALGQLIVIRDPAGRETRFFHDTAGRRVQTTWEDGDGTILAVSRTVFDELGRPLYVQDRMDVPEDFVHIGPTTGRATHNVYDAAGRVVRTERLRDVQLRPVVLQGALNMRLEQAGLPGQDPVLSVTGTEYDAAGRVVASSDARGHVTRFIHDALGRRVQVINALGQGTSHAYDANGNLVSITDARGHVTAYTYDALNRQVSVQQADGRVRRALFDGLGRRVGEVDPHGVTNRFGFDPLGRMVAVTNAWATPDATWATFAFDALGRQIAQTDALGRVTRYTHDAMGRRLSRTLPAGQIEHFTYNTAGNLHRHVQFNGRVIRQEYDAQNRLRARLEDADGTVLEQYTYHPDGQRATMTDASGVTTFSYDAAGRLELRSSSLGDIRYQHDAAGLLTRLHASTTTEPPLGYTYDALGRLEAVGELDPGRQWETSRTIARYAYDAVGNLDQVTLGNGLNQRYHYDRVNRLTQLVLATVALTVAQFDYTLDAAGHRVGLLEQVQGITRQHDWTLDRLHRLTREVIRRPDQAPAPPVGPPTGTTTYTYDRVGNRLARATDVPGLSPQAQAYDANDRLSTDTWDDNGNPSVGTANPAAGPMQCVYDWANRLVRATVGDRTITLTYNADGHRVGKVVREPAPGGAGERVTTTTWLVDDRNPTGYAQVLEEIVRVQTPGQPMTGHDRRFAWGLDLLRESTRPVENWWNPTELWPGTDGLGSTRVLLDGDGQVRHTFSYDAYGTLLAHGLQDGDGPWGLAPPGETLPALHLFAGEAWDADLGLYHNRARYLNPDQGRFWTQDTFEGHPGEPLSLHKYLYVQNNPVMMVDPSGHNGEMPSLMTTVAGISRLASTYVMGMPAMARAAFTGGGVAIGRFLNQFGPVIQNFGRQVIELVPRVEQLRPVLEGFSRRPDWLLRAGNAFTALEGKYQLPRAGEALSRMGSQLQQFTQWASQGPSREVVVWALKSPENMAEAEQVVLQAAGNPQGVRFVYGVEGLFKYLTQWAGF